MLANAISDKMQWVEDTLESMSIEQCIGHLICPEDRNYAPEKWAEIVREIPVGSVFFGPGEPGHLKECLDAIQSNSSVPVLVSSDLEQGCGSILKGCTRFPFPMAWGACDDPQLMEEMGLAVAIEARSHGIHWTYSPVVDLNMNYNNPVVNVRAIGDDADTVSRVAVPFIRGMQRDGLLAACAKHFPGDGTDDRDGHLCTTANLLSCEQWWATFGKVWQSVIDAGVMSIMSGQISFPAYEGHDDISESMPATLSKKLQVDLLRKELGFEGVIVSDAGPMIGMSSRVPANELAEQNILSGSDVYLFANPRKDFDLLMQAVKSGRLDMEQVRTSVRRLLEMKVKLGLHDEGIPLDETQGEVDTAEYVQLSEDIADKSITVIRNDGNIPAKLKKDDRVLTITIKYPEPKGFLPDELEVIDTELEKRGLIVDHMFNPSHREIFDNADKYEKIFVNMFVIPHSRAGTVRLTGETILPFWRAFWIEHPKAVFTSFGSPYHLYECPHLPNMVHAYGPPECSQKAAVKVWLGEIPAEGVLPVSIKNIPCE